MRMVRMVRIVRERDRASRERIESRVSTLAASSEKREEEGAAWSGSLCAVSGVLSEKKKKSPHYLHVTSPLTDCAIDLYRHVTCTPRTRGYREVLVLRLKKWLMIYDIRYSIFSISDF